MPTTFAVSDVTACTAAPPLRPLVGSPDAPASFRAAVALEVPAQLVAGPAVNPLVQAAHVAFADHRPLVLAPDDVWFTVLQAVARHIGANAEALRGRFVAHHGQAAIEIHRDDLHPAMDPPGDWSTVPAELCAAVLERALPAARALHATFSTTDAAARVALDVALLDAMRSYFHYTTWSLCGIPRVTLLGEPDDWAALAHRADALAGMGLDAWLEPLRAVLGEMHRAACGRADRAFWSALYKPVFASGSAEVSGWINVLFPYLEGATAPRDVAPFLRLAREVRADGAGEGERGGGGDEGDDDEDAGARDLVAPRAEDFPSGLARAPFVWRLLGESRAMELVAGHVGVGHDAATGAVRPRFGWCVAPAAPPAEFKLTMPGRRASCLLSPLAPRALTSLASLAREAAGRPSVELSLWNCDQLASLAGVEALASLAAVSLTECPGVTDLAPLAGLPGLREVALQQCAGVRDVSALASLRELECVIVMRCPGVRDIRAIKDLPNLKRVVLWDFPTIPREFQKNITDRGEVLALQAWLRAQG